MNDDRSAQVSDPLLARALELRAEVERFTSRWSPLAETEPCLTIGWAALERQLVELAPTDLQAELVHRLVERTKVYAGLKPAEMVLREVLCLTALVLDECSLEAGPGQS
ncbi:hypothetical protein LJR225_004010 [Phenylobacterium sp. LjRoot225]|uniref:hypothetical protein n=1 Tax=Phenylobacterium sp. LjRoot225 TaxID=3342285 RepID=UPI003ECF450B